MRKCLIDRELDKLNAANHVAYPMIGYTYFADVKGDGATRRRSVYTIINPQGGITYSRLNAKTYAATLREIRQAVASANRA